MLRTFMRFYLRKSLSRKRNWKQRADALIREGRFDEAETRLNKVLRYQQDNPAALSRTAIISERRNDWEAAVARWKRVIETSSGQTQLVQARKKLKQAYVELGNAHKKAGRREEALSCYRKAWSLDAGILAARTGLSDKDFIQLLGHLMDIGKAGDFIAAIVSERAALDDAYLDIYAIMSEALGAKGRSDKYHEALRALFLAHRIDELTFRHLIDVSKYRHPLLQASSFRVNMIRRRRMKQLGAVPDRWLTFSKAAAYAFSDALGIKRPAAIAAAKFEDIKKRNGIVIKPERGSESRGVYLIISENNIRSVHRFKDLHSWEELEKCVREDLETGLVEKDEFRVEEYICGDMDGKTPARDLKFYSFYGEVGLVLEASRYPFKEYWWWSADGKPVETGKYEKPKGEGHGVTQEQIEIAKYISLQIPAPYMRIDFLRGHDEQIYLVEFCSSPGRFEQFNKETDRHLGDLYLKAEMRLFEDVLNGKRFDRIAAFNEEWERRMRRNRT